MKIGKSQAPHKTAGIDTVVGAITLCRGKELQSDVSVFAHLFAFLSNYTLPRHEQTTH